MTRSVLVCLLIFSAAAYVVGDDVVIRKAKSQKLLVLNSGRVFGGQLIARTDGYDVILPSGRMYISSDRIRFIASSMQDAYEKMSDSVQHKTPSIHVQMARWCLTNGLQSQARRELLNALHLDPDHGLARSMLESIVRQQRKSNTEQDTNVDVVAKMAAQRAGIVDRRSLGGLPVESARNFTVRIQSLLSNNCGNVKCHGGSKNQFAFTHIGRGSSVVIAEQNLASVLRQINLSDPENSPLLVKAQSMHGGARSPLFSGRSGRAHLKILQDWVDEVASEMNPSGSGVGVTNATPKSTSISAGNQNIIPAGFESESITELPIDGVKTKQRTKSETDGKFGKAALEAVRNDPFDPMIFNRRYHGQTRSSR